MNTFKVVICLKSHPIILSGVHYGQIIPQYQLDPDVI